MRGSGPVKTVARGLSSALVSVGEVLAVAFCPDGSGGVRDLHAELVVLFSDPAQVAFYLAAVGAVGVHGWIGWGKTVRKTDVLMDKDTRSAVIAAGRWGIVVPVCVGFAAAALHFARF